jgi:hypothetical protein
MKLRINITIDFLTHIDTLSEIIQVQVSCRGRASPCPFKYIEVLFYAFVLHYLYFLMMLQGRGQPCPYDPRKHNVTLGLKRFSLNFRMRNMG